MPLLVPADIIALIVTLLVPVVALVLVDITALLYYCTTRSVTTMAIANMAIKVFRSEYAGNADESYIEY